MSGTVRQRATQQRAEETREAILEAGVELFSAQGFEGTSVRAIEIAAETKRGLVAYHFGDKEALWRAVADRVFADLPVVSNDVREVVQALDLRAQVTAYLTHFIQYSAAHPEVSRLIIQEGKAHSWRLEYLIDHYVRPRLEFFRELVGQEIDAHTLYIFIGAATLVFDVEAECENLFGFNPRNEEFVREHARRLTELMLGALMPE